MISAITILLIGAWMLVLSTSLILPTELLALK